MKSSKHIGVLVLLLAVFISSSCAKARQKTSSPVNTVDSTGIQSGGVEEQDKPIEEFNVMNPSVQANLSGSNTSFRSTSSNWISDNLFVTANALKDYAADQPATMNIEFSVPNATSANVVMATSSSFDASSTVLDAEVSIVPGTNSFELKNMIPGNTYYYKVTSDGNILTKGAFKAVGQVRMIKLNDGYNIRDIGGWIGMNGKMVRYGQIYRGGSLGGSSKSGTVSIVCDEDRAELKRLGIRAQLDLRAKTASGSWPNEENTESYSRGQTTLLDADFINTQTDGGYVNNDASVICDIAWIIYELKRGKPVYFNCRQGADRTGVVAFVIEGLLGCYENSAANKNLLSGTEQLAMDYELTSFSHAERFDPKAKMNSAVRGANAAFNSSSKLFARILKDDISLGQSSISDRCYYYLNRYSNSSWSDSDKALHIDKDDLDWFIKYMLELSYDEYSTPSFAVSGGNLKTVAEARANVVHYVD